MNESRMNRDTTLSLILLIDQRKIFLFAQFLYVLYLALLTVKCQSIRSVTTSYLTLTLCKNKILTAASIASHSNISGEIRETTQQIYTSSPIYLCERSDKIKPKLLSFQSIVSLCCTMIPSWTFCIGFYISEAHKRDKQGFFLCAER